jgi:serine/threonine protein kinase/beta-lactam-binding protein with PASTA domain
VDATVADHLIGRLLDGRYTAQERIAVGGMATVYLAHDNRLDRLVALKVMHQAFAHDQDFVRRFHREANAAARLNTPHAVSVLDQGREDTAHGPVIYLVMELVRGHTLRQVIGTTGPLDVGSAVDVIDQVLEALAAAHAAGIIHRDIKPENILIGTDGRVKVADFGLARPVAQPTQAMTHGMVMGTVGYLAPEQVSDGRADTRSDVYAAGIVLFEMLTGHPPHTGENPMSVAYQSVHGDVPAPSTVVGGIPPALDAFVVRAAARDPAARPADGAAMAAELRAILPYLPTSRARDENSYAGYSRWAASSNYRPDTGEQPRPTGLYTPVGSGGGRGLDHDDDHFYPAGGRPRPSRRGPLLAGAALLALALVVGILALRTVGGDGKISVPPLIKITKADAEQTLRQAGLTVTYAPAVNSSIVPKDQVVSQQPASGARVGHGAAVRLTLSLGPAAVVVPSVAGLSETGARAALTQYRLNVQEPPRKTSDDTIQAGLALRTDPPVGSKLAPGSSVVLYLSTGPSSIQIPSSIQGKDFQAATDILAGLGLTTQESDQVDAVVPAGQVFQSSPAVGQTAQPGQTVVLYVSTGTDDPGDGSGQIVVVPDVKGKSVGDARNILRAAGLNVDTSFFHGGKVSGTDPPAGTQVEHGSTVHLKTHL